MDNRQQFPNYDYSTLEVAPQQPGDHNQVPPQQQQPDYSHNGYAHGGYPEQTYQTDPRKYSPQPYEGHNLPQVVDQTYPEVAPKPEGPEVVENAPKGDYAGYGEHQHSQHPVVPAERRIWGLKRKTFFILLAIALLVIVGAVVGGAVGATVGKKGEKSGASDPGTGGGSGGGSGGGGGGSSPGSKNNSPVLGTSQITAINWTDSSSVEYNAVFWQAKTNDLMMSLWDSKGKNWTQVNITDKMTDTSMSVAAKPGTPLAAAARGYPWTSSTLKNVAGDFGIALFYLSPQNTILEIYSKDPRGASWALGDLTTSKSTNIKAAPDTQLSAWWGLCERNCSGSILLVYEDDSQTLQLANSTDWDTTPVLRNIAAGASLAITACAGNRGNDGPARNAARVYYDSSNKLSELMWSPPGPWYYGSDLSPGMPPTPPRISATAFSNAADLKAGAINLLVVGSQANGSAFASYWDNSTWHNASAPLLQGKVLTNFTSLSVFQSSQVRLFGLTNESEIHSFVVDRKNPLSWTYDQAVITG